MRDVRDWCNDRLRSHGNPTLWVTLRMLLTFRVSRALIVVLWRAGLRIGEAVALTDQTPSSLAGWVFAPRARATSSLALVALFARGPGAEARARVPQRRDPQSGVISAGLSTGLVIACAWLPLDLIVQRCWRTGRPCGPRGRRARRQSACRSATTPADSPALSAGASSAAVPCRLASRPRSQTAKGRSCWSGRRSTCRSATSPGCRREAWLA